MRDTQMMCSQRDAAEDISVTWSDALHARLDVITSHIATHRGITRRQTNLLQTEVPTDPNKRNIRLARKERKAYCQHCGKLYTSL